MNDLTWMGNYEFQFPSNGKALADAITPATYHQFTVSIPFKRESSRGLKLIDKARKAANTKRFQFPSNGKALADEFVGFDGGVLS